MAIPDFQSIFLPLLKQISDGGEHRLRELVEVLADTFRLSPDERKQLLPSGTQRIFANRVGWARTYLKKPGLLESPARGMVRISQRGLEVLKGNPEKLDVRFLRQFPEFMEWHESPKEKTSTVHEEISDTGTPEEILEAAYQELRRTLAQDLLDRVKQATPRFFEKLVVELLVAMGYGGSLKDAGEAVGQSGDGGIDGIIKEDKLGLDAIYIQAKRWESSVGRPVVQAFAGSLEGQRARKGVLITTSRFSSDATDYVSRIEKKIVLIDGEQLSQLMIDHGIGVTESVTYKVRKLDLDYFEEGD
jgi:restriction system protein